MTTRQAKIVSMELTSCDQRQEDQNWRYAGGAIAKITGWIVKLTADTGEVGHGYSQSVAISSDGPDGAETALELLKKVVVGRSVFDIENILHDMDRTLYGHLHAKSGVDFALHELQAQVLKVPLHTLFGGAVVTSLPNTRIVPICEPELAAEKSMDLVRDGYTNIKIKFDGNASQDIERIRQIRKRVGDDIRICVDPNQAYTNKGALMTLRQVGAMGVDMAEQPVHGRDLAGLKLLRESLDMYIEADECVQCLDDVMKVIKADAADCINFKVSRMGGLRNTFIAARMCHVAGIGYRIGAAFGPRFYTAQIAHMASTFRAHFYPHELAEFDHFADDPSEGIEIEKGVLNLPAGVGSGTLLF